MSLVERVRALAADVPSVDVRAAEAARRHQRRLATPAGGLGRVEDLAVQLAAIAGRSPAPVPGRPAAVVAAADHGVHAGSGGAGPQPGTARMVGTLLDDRAAVSAVAAAVGAQVSVLDVGIAGPALHHPRLRRARARDATAAGPAAPEEAARALLAGAGLAEELVASGVDLLVPAAVGDATTTASACLVAALTGHPPDAVAVLAEVGGLEHAALAGVILSAAADGVPVVLDGLAALAAALVAVTLAPDARGYLIAGHRCTEPAAGVALDHLGLTPVLELGVGLGEGTGGLLAVPVVVAAAATAATTITLDELTGPGPAGTS